MFLFILICISMQRSTHYFLIGILVKYQEDILINNCLEKQINSKKTTDLLLKIHKRCRNLYTVLFFPKKIICFVRSYFQYTLQTQFIYFWIRIHSKNCIPTNDLKLSISGKNIVSYIYDSFLVNDTLDEMLDESGDEEESDNIITQVLDEIGIEISGKVCRFWFNLIKCYTSIHTHSVRMVCKTIYMFWYQHFTFQCLKCPSNETYYSIIYLYTS